MERVLGIGGVFFKARDPQSLARWYRDNLGVALEPDQSYGLFVASEGDQTVFSIFDAGSDYFPGHAMINFRVRDLDAMLEQLRAAGADVDPKVSDEPYGRFGWATDPEGNRMELFEPR